MNNVDVVLKFKELCDKSFPSPEAMKQSPATDLSYQSGVQAVKNDMAKLILGIMQQEVATLEVADKMPEVEVTKENVPQPIRFYLMTKGYTVFFSEKMKLWQASDSNYMSLLRGGDLTEDGAWFACYKDWVAKS
jgi:flagellar biogenesis protein FliO